MEVNDNAGLIAAGLNDQRTGCSHRTAPLRDLAMQAKPSGRVFPALTGLRGVTAASVALLHFSGAFLALLPASEPILRLTARIAFRMDVFFILTGFILSFIYIRRQEKFSFRTHWEFLLARFTRIYPGHLAMFLFLFAGVIVAGILHVNIEGKYSMSAIAPQLALVQAWPLFTWAQWDWNYPSWFLSALWFSYIFIFPCVWMLTPKIRKSKWLLVWLLGPLIVRLPLTVFSVAPGLWLVLRASCDIISGCVLYILYSNDSQIFRAAQKHVDKLVLAGLLALSIALVLNAGPSAWLLINSLGILASPFLIAGLTAETSIIVRFLQVRPLLWLGKLSYALFISHAVAQKILKIILPGERFSGSPLALRCLILASYLVAVLAFAAAVNRLVELPCLAALKKKVKRSESPSARQILPAPSLAIQKNRLRLS
jgi:peptidoglycan/LPS O-acetylase OafA/YrhL